MQCERCGAPMHEYCEYCDYAEPALEGLIEDESPPLPLWVILLSAGIFAVMISWIEIKWQVLTWWW